MRPSARHRRWASRQIRWNKSGQTSTLFLEQDCWGPCLCTAACACAVCFSCIRDLRCIWRDGSSQGMAAGTSGTGNLRQDHPHWLLFVTDVGARGGGRGMGPVLALGAAYTKPYGRHLFHRRDGHDSGLRRHPAEVSLATSRDIDCDNGGADVRLFNGDLFVILQDVWVHHFIRGPVEEPSKMTSIGSRLSFIGNRLKRLF